MNEHVCSKPTRYDDEGVPIAFCVQDRGHAGNCYGTDGALWVLTFPPPDEPSLAVKDQRVQGSVNWLCDQIARI